MALTYAKPALTFEQQLQLLEGRGLRIHQREAALRALQRISYYRLSGYWHPFKNADNTFQADGSFEEAVWLYEFDHRLRVHLLEAIERFEVEFRTRLTYEVGHAFGAFGHCEAANFANSDEHREWNAGLKQELERSHETFIEHFRKSYADFPRVPIWMATECMSFGLASRLYKGLNSSLVKQAVASTWGLKVPVAASWLQALNYVRNLCAHHARLWNRELRVKPVIPDERNLPGWSKFDNRRPFFTVCMLSHLLALDSTRGPWVRRAVELIAELEATPKWLRAFGAPPDWRQVTFLRVA